MISRKETLEQAIKTVCSDREGQYGSPEDNFKRIADLWTTYCGGYRFEPKDVAMMMSLLKIARIATGKHKDDNYIDLAGYAACGAELGAREPREPDTLPEDGSLDGLEITIAITDDFNTVVESDKEYIKRLSQTVSQLTGELEKVKDDKSIACGIWEKTYDDAVQQYRDEIDALKDKNHTLYIEKLRAVENYNNVLEQNTKLEQEIDKLKRKIDIKRSIHHDRLNEAIESIERKDDEIRKLRTDRDVWAEKYKNLAATVVGKETE